jgi:hypothetical protein
MAAQKSGRAPASAKGSIFLSPLSFLSFLWGSKEKKSRTPHTNECEELSKSTMQSDITQNSSYIIVQRAIEKN